jgi:hypothetical protein
MGSSRVQFKWNSTSLVNSSKGFGFYSSLGITERIFFMDNIGMSFSLENRLYYYSALKSEVGSNSDSKDVADYSSSKYIGLWGIHIGIGLAIKF